MSEPSDRPSNRPSVWGLVVALLLATIGPMSMATAGPSASAAPKSHSCCCGASCQMVNCGCLPKTPARDLPPSPASSIATDDDQGEILSIDLFPCIGPRPCGGDDGAPPSLTSPRERPAVLTTRDRPEGEAGRSPLPQFVDRFSSQLPDDLPDDPPEPSRLAALV